MIHDPQGFQFSQLNSLLPGAFLQEGKKIKANKIINGSVTFKLYESYNTLYTELLKLTLKNLTFEFSKKNMIKPPLIWLIYLTL